MGDFGLRDLFWGAAITLAISVPLGLWKLVEIVLWLFHNVHIGGSHG
jgi:hypothetical protein